MANRANDVFGEGKAEQDTLDDQERLAEAFATVSAVAEEDQTRSTLHYGSDEDGALNSEEPMDGARISYASAGEPRSTSDAQAVGTPGGIEDGTAMADPPHREMTARYHYAEEAGPPLDDGQGSAEGVVASAAADDAALPNAAKSEMQQAAVPEDVRTQAGFLRPEGQAKNDSEKGETPPSDRSSETELSAFNLDASVVSENPSDGSENLSTAQQREGFQIDKAAQDGAEDNTKMVNGELEPEPPIGTVTEANEAPTGIALSNAAVAENISGAIVGRLTVSDPNADDTHSFQVSDDRFEVVDGTLRLKEGENLLQEEESQIDVEVTATDAAGSSVAEVFSINMMQVPEMSASSGFKAEYFDVDHNLSKIEDIDWDCVPTHQAVTSDINYANGHGSFWQDGSKDTFGAKITGNIAVEEGGSFAFFLGGDDGAMLFVNGYPVINNDGEHGFRTRSGEVELEPGTHHIEVLYFENYGRAGLKLEWEGPGLDGRELVAAPEQEAMQTISGVPLAIDLDLGETALSVQESLKMSNLPKGTIVSAGKWTTTVEEAGTVDITGRSTDVLSIAPPPDFIGTVEANVTVTMQDPSGHTAEATHSLSFDVNEAHVGGPNVSMVGGFKASYFDVDHSLKKIDDIDWDSEPTHQDFVSDIHYANGRGSFWEGGSADTFGAKLEGQVTVDEGGLYKFFAGGDDGVMLYVNGEPVINNDGLHGFRTRTGEVQLEPGTYDIEVRYFENYGHAGLKLEWEGPGTDGRELVTADLDTHMDQNGSLEVGIDLESAGSDATILVEGLPADTILYIGEDPIVADGSPVDLTGLDVSVMEVSPPPGFEGTINGFITATDTAFNGTEVQSSSPFTLQVGDPDLVADTNGTVLPSVDEDLLVPANDNDVAWNESADNTENDTAPDDVLSEPVPVVYADDALATNTETYERSDW
ncbi:MAG: PA14 domain-containing protein [Pseudomonadota bacterium]